MTGWLRDQIVRLGRGSPVEREAARVARRAFSYSAQVGPHQIAADHGAGTGANLGQIAHAFAVDTAPARFVDLAGQAAVDGFSVYLISEASVDRIAFETIREVCAENGPWPFHEGERTAREVAEQIADHCPGLERQGTILAALIGFDEHLEQLAASLEG